MKKKGFTLIELLATFVILGIFSVLLVSFLGPYILRSTQPAVNLQNISSLNTVMSNITGKYNQFKIWTAKTTYAIGDTVVPTTTNNHYYTCTEAGVSGTKQPTDWTTSSVIDGTVRWSRSSESVLEYILNYACTTYASYIPSGQIPSYTTDFSYSDGSQVLKVVVASSKGGSLTSYFVGK